MTRTPVQWVPETSGTVTTDNDTVVRVTEGSETRVTEGGENRVLEPNVVTTKNQTEWTNND